MFIANVMNPTPRSSGAQCLLNGIETGLPPLERDSFGGRAFYKHLAPNGAKNNNFLLHF
jgi:hypothetical protein